jgi:MtN3 and saliva related transmembrane protein
MTNSTSTEIIVFDTIGIVGGAIYPICTIPQIVRVIKTKSSKDLELSSIILFLFATGLILVYSVYFKLFPVYIPSSFDFLVQSILLGLKVYYDKKANKIKNVKNSKKEPDEEKEDTS